MKENPTIKIYAIGRRYFNYTITLVEEDGTIKEVKGSSIANNPIIIPIHNE